MGWTLILDSFIPFTVFDNLYGSQRGSSDWQVLPAWQGSLTPAYSLLGPAPARRRAFSCLSRFLFVILSQGQQKQQGLKVQHAVEWMADCPAHTSSGPGQALTQSPKLPRSSRTLQDC